MPIISIVYFSILLLISVLCNNISYLKKKLKLNFKNYQNNNFKYIILDIITKHFFICKKIKMICKK